MYDSTIKISLFKDFFHDLIYSQQSTDCIIMWKQSNTAEIKIKPWQIKTTWSLTKVTLSGDSLRKLSTTLTFVVDAESVDLTFVC